MKLTIIHINKVSRPVAKGNSLKDIPTVYSLPIMYYLSSHYSKIKLKTKLKKAERVLDIGSAKNCLLNIVLFDSTDIFYHFLL